LTQGNSGRAFSGTKNSLLLNAANLLNAAFGADRIAIALEDHARDAESNRLGVVHLTQKALQEWEHEYLKTPSALRDQKYDAAFTQSLIDSCAKPRWIDLIHAWQEARDTKIRLAQQCLADGLKVMRGQHPIH
jgi:hypothetical protein